MFSWMGGAVAVPGEGYPAPDFELRDQNADSHREFAEKYQLPFPLLSDIDGKAASAYGSLFSLGP